MALQKREKLLVIVTGALLVVFLIAALFTSGGGGQLSSLRAQHESLSEEVETKEQVIQSGRDEMKQMVQWQKRSLPSKTEHARSLYQNWLRDLVDQASFRHVKVDSSGGQSRGGVYTALTFTVHGDATMDQLSHFLFDFYSAGHLHKIRYLSIKPTKDSTQLSLLITVEGLSLPGADRSDALSEEPSERLKLAKVDDYVKAIAKRRLDDERDPADDSLFVRDPVDGGLFVAYKPPPPPYVAPAERTEPPKPPEFDPTTQTYLNAIVEVNGRPQVWLFVRSSGKTLKYYEGDKFEIGPAHGTIARIDPREVELTVGGQSAVLALGDNLREQMPEKLPEESPEDVPEDLSEPEAEISEDVPEDLSEPEAEISEDVSEKSPEETAGEATGDSTDDPRNEPPEPTPADSPEDSADSD